MFVCCFFFEISNSNMCCGFTNRHRQGTCNTYLYFIKLISVWYPSSVSWSGILSTQKIGCSGSINLRYCTAMLNTSLQSRDLSENAFENFSKSFTFSLTVLHVVNLWMALVSYLTVCLILFLANVSKKKKLTAKCMHLIHCRILSKIFIWAKWKQA